MSKRLRRAELGQFLRFAAVGVVNTGVGLAAIIALERLTPAGPYAANAGGYVLGLATSFVLNRLWTFRAAGPAGAQAVRFAAAFAACYALNLGVLTLGLAAGAPGWAAQGAAVAGYTLAFFALGRLVVFR